MLILKPNCECCDRDLPANASNAMICTYECTFCIECAQTELKLICPNCSDRLVLRPVRSIQNLDKHPASLVRVYNPNLRAI